MGQKVHPTGIRLGIVKKHTSTWYAGNKDYADKLNQDLTVRDFITKKLAHASVSRVDIERPSDSARITIHTARPGIVIGKKGEDVEQLRNEIAKQMGCAVQRCHRRPPMWQSCPRFGRNCWSFSAALRAGKAVQCWTGAILAR